MKEEDILEDVKQAEEKIEQEDRHENHEHSHKKQRRKNILWSSIAFLLVLMFLAWYIPSESIVLDPEPKHIPTLSELYVEIEKPNATHIPIENIYQYNLLLTPQDPAIKEIADRVVVQSCESNERICFAKALFYFVRDNFDYVSDPLAFEYVKSARESLVTQGGDCDDASVLLSNLLRSVGFETRFVFIPGHVYVEVYVPQAPQKYKIDSHWISVDATCRNCAFGELHWRSFKAEKRYV